MHPGPQTPHRAFSSILFKEKKRWSHGITHHNVQIQRQPWPPSSGQQAPCGGGDGGPGHRVAVVSLSFCVYGEFYWGPPVTFRCDCFNIMLTTMECIGPRPSSFSITPDVSSPHPHRPYSKLNVTTERISRGPRSNLLRTWRQASSPCPKIL